VNRPPVLDLTRTFAAPRERVWHAWTTADGLATWWWSHLPGTTYAVDLRVDGAYRIEATAAGFGVAGRFVDVVAPERLSMTWTWLDESTPGPEEHVAVTFTEVPGGTRLDLRHTGPWTTTQPVEDYRTGWAQTLDALEALTAPAR
jgi:uncharacterized protein YndB with AHSA1/START domain